MDPELQQLAAVFQATLSPDKDAIKAAEQQLKAAAQQPGYCIKVLKLTATPIDDAIRQSAAVNFKNVIKYRWVPSEADLYGGAQPLPDAEKAQIKQLLLGVTLGSPHRVAAQLSEALSIICGYDFPAKWPELLPELVTKLATEDLTHIKGVLQVANNVFKRFRGQPSSNNVLAQELDMCQQAFLRPLHETHTRLAGLFPATTAPGAPVEPLRQLLGCMRLSFRIFYSLCSMGLSDATEGELGFWMDEMHKCLTYENPALDETDPEKESVLDGVKTAVCQTVDLLLEIDEDTFKPYLQRFAASVWGVLMKVSHKPGQDNLAMAAIKFLNTIAKGVFANLFQADGALQQICESVIVPNLRVRPEDEEMFEMNPTEYIRRDAEGGDSDTRRRAAADLVRSLTDRFPAEVSRLFTGYITAALADYSAAPAANWRSKDCAIYMVTALSVKGRTAAHGATSTTQLVNLLDFYSAQVLPELQSPKLNDNPLLKADAVKFVTTFRSMLPKEACLAAVPCLVNLLGSEYCVVHSYAAICLERLLSLKDPATRANRFTSADLGPHLQALLERLFAGFKLPDSSENEYLMKAIMRVIVFVGPAIAPVSAVCLQRLAAMLVEVCKNPRNPSFNHYLFESVAALIRHGTAASAAAVADYEQALFPAFELVLQQDVQEFHPYVFQIFSQLIELRPAPLPQLYLAIFPPLLSPVFWERSGNVPALVRLLQAYLTKAGAEVVAGGHLVAVLGVFQKLLSSKAHDHEGFYIVNAIVESLPLPAYAQYLPSIWTLMFQRLTGSKTPKFCRFFVVFLALFICKHGPAAAAEQLDKVQPGILFMLLGQVWLPTLPGVDGPEEEKLVAVAGAKLLTELPGFNAAAPGDRGALWAALRKGVVDKLTGGGSHGGSGQEDEEPDFEEMQGYTAAYAKLANAAKAERPVLGEIPDPKQYVEAALARVGA
ncbi:hypothetical protein HYH02_003876 [Chlamydomonas schloesseri]|uniref:Importin N-terminal domain-containing protein n=1 Tax=Chlamydomonas schloesseri TaxID=2026947 RepID=A0A836B9J8_9CHLO|nr:hypothetical protein HYH02_003876 [Chlamydomonas schloesseri]|eukprot:KAG2451269.1 hypothetical protein HYH02_003876 [Chlamydomonas schloesseri]